MPPPHLSAQGQAHQHPRPQQQQQNVTATFSTVRTTSQVPPLRPLSRVATSCAQPASAPRRSLSINANNYSTGCATLQPTRSHSLSSTATTVNCSLCGRRYSRNKNGQPHQHNCRPVHPPVAAPQLPSALPRFPSHPLQAAPGTDTIPPGPFQPLQPLPPVDLLAPDTIIPLEPLDALLALLPDGAILPVDDPETLAPLAPVIPCHRRASMVLWSAGHLHLLQTTIRSRIKGEFNDNLLALLSDSPPGAVPLPTLATVAPLDDLMQIYNNRDCK